MKFDLPKQITTAVWLLVVVNLLVSFSSWAALTLHIIGVFLVVAHLIEYLVYKKVIDQKPEGALLAFVMTILYGVFYWKDFPAKKWEAE
jgi:uncharacterized protein YhhL (DUF1145 family)